MLNCKFAKPVDFEKLKTMHFITYTSKFPGAVAHVPESESCTPVLYPTGTHLATHLFRGSERVYFGNLLHLFGSKLRWVGRYIYNARNLVGGAD